MYLRIDKRVVMLEVCAEAFELEGGPDGELGHGVGLGGPAGELVGVEGEVVLHFLDAGAGLEEEDLFADEMLAG